MRPRVLAAALTATASAAALALLTLAPNASAEDGREGAGCR